MRIFGEISIPGDKSIAHRAIILASICAGESKIRNVPDSKDVLTTINLIRKCGINIQEKSNYFSIQGGPFSNPDTILDCKNSGTSMRLLAGLLSYKKIPCTLIGDKSLSSRPMERVVDPLIKMGNKIDCINNHAPIKLESFSNQSLGEYQIPIPSAQVKSCLILASLGCSEKTKIIEKIKTRDHLELMINAIDDSILYSDGLEIVIDPNKDKKLDGFAIDIPGDVSSASYLIAAAIMLNKSELIISNLLLNPHRIGFINTLIEMGADIEVESEEVRFNERVGRVVVRGGRELSPIKIAGDKIPYMIDEIPILSLICAHINGKSVISGLEELRYKESDRLEGVCHILTDMGGSARIVGKDEVHIEGKNKLYNTTKLNNFNDHRLAMMISIAQILSGDTVSYPECIDISFPKFKYLMNQVLEA